MDVGKWKQAAVSVMKYLSLIDRNRVREFFDLSYYIEE